MTSENNVESDGVWAAALRGDREAFRAAVKPYLGELLRTARHEVRYRRALGDFDADDPSAEELVGETLVRAWQQRDQRPLSLGLRVWLSAMLYRVARALARRQGRRRRLPTQSLERPPPPEPVYDDDEEFWEWYQPEEILRLEDVVEAGTVTPEEDAEIDEQLTRTLDPHAREVFLLCELHRVPLAEAALALQIPLDRAARLLEAARHDLGLSGDKNLI